MYNFLQTVHFYFSVSEIIPEQALTNDVSQRLTMLVKACQKASMCEDTCAHVHLAQLYAAILRAKGNCVSAENPSCRRHLITTGFCLCTVQVHSAHLKI